MPPTRHVLIVEDHPEVRAMLTHVVAQLYPNATIAETANGAEALSMATQHRPDLIISDYQMPIMDGRELMHALRAQGAAMTILMISSDPSIGATLLREGATAFLTKPFRIHVLRELLHTLLGEDQETRVLGQ